MGTGTLHVARLGMDVREGGASIVCMKEPDEWGRRERYNAWAFAKVVPMESIAFIPELSDSRGATVDPAALKLPREFPLDQRSLVTSQAATSGRSESTVTEFGWTPGQMMTLSETRLNRCMDKLAAGVTMAQAPN